VAASTSTGTGTSVSASNRASEVHPRREGGGRARRPPAKEDRNSEAMPWRRESAAAPREDFSLCSYPPSPWCACS